MLKFDLGTVAHLNIGAVKTVATQFMELQKLIRLGKKLGLSTLMFFTIPTALVEAQITPDGSLPTTVEQLQEIMNINGGERAGNNLFHSFEEFSIPEGMEAVFENATDIENIFTRITGEEASAIDGILKTQGDANFFLINPNGIVFGENARLDVGGSFIATTADSIQFADKTEFTATETEDSTPLLTNEIPIGLGFGSNSNSGSITVNGAGNQITNDSSFSPIEFSQTPTGISLPDNRTLALVGNGIDLNGGVVTTEGGQIDLVSVDSGTVGINQTETGFTLFNDGITKYQDINLNQQSLIDASKQPEGAISLTGQNINLKDASFLLSQNRGDLLGSSLDVTAYESVSLSGQSDNTDISSAIRAETLGTGEGGDVDISANQLNLLDSGRIQTAAFGEGQGGNVNVQTSNNIRMNSGIVSSITLGEADAGNIELSASELKLNNTAVLTASTLGNGNGGEININANVISLDGTSGLSENRTNISSSSFRGGDGGNLSIDTRQLFVKDGASVGSTAVGTGSTGSVTVNASESIDISGSNPNFQGSNSIESSIRAAVQAPSGRPELPTGNSGSVTVNTPVLNVFQQGAVSVQNQGAGNAGTLSINAEEINLNESGSITAASASGQGGNINLNTNQLQLDENSSITATAENDGDGGNININTTSLFAKKNSEITADAFAGTGGNIQIDTQGLFRFPDSTIEASSELGIDGTVRIDTLDTNLQKDLEASELNLIVDEDSLANSCLARRNKQQGSFVINNGNDLSTTGESGFYDSGSITGMDNFFSNSEEKQFSVVKPQFSENLIPAQQAVKTESGRTFLVSAPESIKSLICD